ncbi:baculoviral IAP repeat-containing protein 7-A-like [Ostrea edulis]|uniref:baculoviral IAP repeat-containing protein 7-A-like n=1 Tax=Ostrea edulis TaxID=37623 RepID=UPI0024AFBEF0|nr:baculoviral IAP repeat-containing protein 7-A-like [Ostrea edulis]
MQGNSKKTALEQLGVSFDKPKYPTYSVLATRITTFSNWTHHQPMDKMAKAGFYYTGNGDNVRCFFCGNGLENWEKEDDPWVEHAHWFPKCVFLLQCKGNSFVQKVQQILAQRQSSQTKNYETGNYQQYQEERGVVSSPSSPECSLQSVAAITALQMGYSEVLVRKAISVWNSRQSSESFTVTEIVNVILDLQNSDSGYGSLEDLQQKNVSEGENVTKTSESNASDLLENIENKSVENVKSKSTDRENCDSGYNSEDENERTDSSANSNGETEKLRAENKQLRDTLICKVCMDNTVSVIFLPCTHMVTCSQCFPAMKQCPICRSDIKAIVKAYLV